MEKYKTVQEKFWAEEFGNDYIERNKGAHLLASNLNFFIKALSNADKINSCLEFGANIGMNLQALGLIFPNIVRKGIEINATACIELEKLIGSDNVFHNSIFDVEIKEKSDLVLIKTVLIHINPEMLEEVYQKLYDASSKYILIAEYYNPSPVSVSYRGHSERLFKRDFAGEFLNKFQDVTLVDYGFVYKRDLAFPQDDITWFLLKKHK
jgi:spore coat polysaccharide biosynthesis protein SpsF